MPRLSLCRVVVALALTLLAGVRAHAVTVYDLNASPTLPTIIDGANSPVYITNLHTDEPEEPEEPTTLESDGDGDGDGDGDSTSSNTVDTLRIGARSQLHLGYGNTNEYTAKDAVSVKVAGDAHVEGLLRLGKDATYYADGLPNAASTQSIALDIGGVLRVTGGGDVILNGYRDPGEGTDEEMRHSVLTANSVVLDGGSLTLEKFSRLNATGTSETDGWYGVTIRNGGALVLNSGLPASFGNPDAETEEPDPAAFSAFSTADTDTDESELYDQDGGNDYGDTYSEAEPGEYDAPDGDSGGEPVVRPAARALLDGDGEAWTFKGVSVGSGSGILVESGGSLAAGRAGGVVRGANTGENIVVRKGGVLDAGRGGIIASQIDNVSIAGTYRAGYDAERNEIAGLTVVDGTTTFESGSTIALSRGLARFVNKGGNAVDWSGGAGSPGNVILRGTSVNFAAGGLPTLETGMGTYNLELGGDNDYLRIGSVSGAVMGNAAESDRAQFHSNMSGIWSPGDMSRSQSDVIYNLTALETPTVTASGEAGELNKAVLEAMVDGKGQAVTGHGYVDNGVFEMYNGAAQWGVNSVALGTSAEFMSQLDRRVERIGAEMDRLGESWSGGQAFASCAAPEVYMGRIWAGGFGREERADFGASSGYRYRPGGVVLGYDREVGGFNLGGAFAYGSGSYTDLAASANDSKIKSYSGGLYGSYHSNSGLFVSAQGTYTHLDNKLSDIRGGMRRRADHTSYSWTLGAKIGYDMYLADRITLTPSGGLNRAQAVNKAHDEFLDDVGVLRIGQVKRDSLTAPLEVTLGFDVMRTPESLLRLTGTVGYAYDFDDGAIDGTFDYLGLGGSNSMSVTSRKPGRNRFNAGAGLLFTGNRLDFTARYDYYQRRDQKTHQARGSIGLKF